MRALTISSAPHPDRTLAVALAIVGVFGAVQLASVGYYYAERSRAAHVASQPVVVATPVPMPTAAPLKTTVTAPHVALATPPPPPPPPRSEQLLEEAKVAREKGDNAGALALLQDASQRDPKNANVFAEMAKIYESMQNYDRANESWRKIQELGPSAGALSDLADMKLKIGAAPAATEAGPGLAGISPLDAGTTRNDTEGIPDGSTFGITEVKASEAPDPDAETNLTLRISVRKRPNSLIDHTKVKIQVFFYDTENDKEVVLTDADVNYEWITPKHDWKEANPEILQVTYVRPKEKPISADAALTAAAAAVVPPVPGKKARPAKPPAPGSGADVSHRKYLGYIVRIYYNDQLQAVRADPTKLLNLFPPPFTAPSSQ